MEKAFWLDANIPALRDSVPIRFAHHKSVDRPENHALHINNYIEIYLYISGNHQYIVENTVYNLQRGDIIIINPREVHKALPAGEVMYERFYFLVDIHCLEGIQWNPLTRILNRPAGKGNLLCPDEPTRAQILQTLYAISDCFQDGRDEQLKAFGYFLQILSEINRHFDQDTGTAVTVTHTPELLAKILSYVAENTASIQTTAEIAQALGLTPQYLSTYFSKYIGTPLKVYIQAKKIALAKDLLDKGADVTQACYDSGFNDCSYFIRIFKKYVGTTPLRYKQESSAKMQSPKGSTT